MKILVTGGAGYIGSFMVRQLKDSGHEVKILDDMSSGHEKAVVGFEIFKHDLAGDINQLNDYMQKERFDGVIHMASFIQMGESFKNPSKYYRNNIIGFLNLLDSMVKAGTKKVVISSSAGVYGNPENLPILEEDKKDPLNPYGETKYMLERIADDYSDAYGLKYVSFRYFNAAGALLDGHLGEDHPDESHLIPNIIKKALNNEAIEIFGNDYPTPDGTCVRDYIHVLDIADVHEKGINYLDQNENNIFNIGIGRGYSNKEIIDLISKIANIDISVKYGPRRQGDAASLFASNEKAKKILGWVPKYGIDEIITSALLWHKNHPQGYSSWQIIGCSR